VPHPTPRAQPPSDAAALACQLASKLRRGV
jgi:hypothetical protein